MKHARCQEPESVDEILACCHPTGNERASEEVLATEEAET